MSPNPADRPLTGKEYRDYEAPDSEARGQAIWWTIVALLLIAVVGYGAFAYYSPTSTTANMGVTDQTSSNPATTTPNATGTAIPEVPAPSNNAQPPTQR